MPYDVTRNSWTRTPLMERLFAEKTAGRELQERKHADWDDNYMLYRNKVKTNRLTQRQAVNIPLMKETVKTLLSRVDDPPEIDWKELGSDETKELIYQEIWNENARRNKLNLVDIVDKKNVLLYGTSTKKLNIDKFGVSVELLDVYDVTFDPLMKPWDIDSARFVIHQNIFRSVKDILADERYTEQGKNDLKLWADSTPGIVSSEQNKEDWEKKMERLKSMGVTNDEFDLFAGGDRVVNLTEHFTKMWNPKKKKFEKRVVVYAEDTIELLDEKLEDLIGVDFWPFVTWSEDPETTDIYPDSVGDLVRTPNKVLNVWFSQLIENRTLKNFQMHWFLPSQNYTPQTYTPGPGVMLPAPPGDDINKTIKPVEVSGLDDTLRAIESVVRIVEKGSGASALDKGQKEKGEQTLGEVKILAGKTMERAVTMAKFYRTAWYELAVKWNKMMHANAPSFMKLSKTSKSGKIYQKRVFRNDWKSEAGYEPVVTSSSEQESETMSGIQKFMFVLQQFPNNEALKRIGQKRMLELLDITPEERNQISEAEKTTVEPAPLPPESPQAQQAQSAQPAQPAVDNSGNAAIMADIQNSLSTLGQ